MQRFSAKAITLGIFVWSQVFLPVIALLASFASAVRTFYTAAQIYSSADIDGRIVIVVAAAITIAAEGSIFFLALAQERQHIQWRQAKKRRHVVTIKTLWRGLLVRLGREEPLSYDQMPEGDTSLSFLIWTAFFIALVSNLYVGMRPLIERSGTANLQTIIIGLPNAGAQIQSDFFADIAFSLFPPFMALVSGKLTARFASKMSSQTNRSTTIQEKDIKQTSEPKRSKVRKTAFERISEHLVEHPEDEMLSQRQLAERVGVSVGSVNAFNKSRSMTQEAEPPVVSTNGRH